MTNLKLSTKERVLLICLSSLVFCFAIAMDLYLPFLPVMKVYLNASQLQMQLTLSFFILFFGFAQLLFGPLIDKNGAKFTALLGAGIYTASCFLPILCSNIDVFILLRIIQSVGGSAMLVSAYSITNEVFPENKAGKVFSYLAGSIAFSPMLGPMIGSYLGTLFSWRSCFYLLTIVGVFSFIVTSLLIPRKRTKPRKQSLSEVQYRDIFKNSIFVKYALSSSLGFTCFFSFLSCSTYLFSNYFHIPQAQFGVYFGLIALFFIIGNFLSAQFVTLFGSKKLTLLGGILMICGGLLMQLSEKYGFLIFMFSMSIVCFGAANVIGAGTARAIKAFPASGVVSAVLGCVQFSFASIVGTLVMFYPADSIYPLAVMLILLGITCLLTHGLHMNKLKAHFFETKI